jgi:predicted RND superfamily exporter protein
MDELTFDAAAAGNKERPCFKPTDIRDYAELNTAVKAVIDKPQYASLFEYYPVGNPAEAEYTYQRQQEMGVLWLVALGIMIVLLWFLFRSFAAVVWAISIVIFTALWTIGISGFVGMTITPLFVLTAFLMLTVGMADAVHLMSGYLFYRREEGLDHASALRHTYEKAGVACLLTSITNVIGMVVLCVSNIIPVRVVGLMGGISVSVALVMTIYLLPMLLELWPPVPKHEQAQKEMHRFLANLVPNFRTALQRRLEMIIPAVEKRPIAYSLPFIVMLVVCLWGSFRANVDSDMLSLYRKDSKFPQSVRIVDDKMSGSSQMAIYMDLGASRAVEDPFVLNVIDGLQEKFKTRYGKYVVTTSSIVDTVKDTYRKLNRGESDKYVIPPDEGQLSQTLYLFNNAATDLRKRLVDDEYQKANVTITLRNGSTYEYDRVFEDMQKDVYESLNRIKTKYPAAQVSITGMFVLKMKLEHLLILTGMQAFGLAFIVINVLFFVIFVGSAKAGLIAIVPNIIPSIIDVGLMGMLGIPLDFFAIVLCPIIIGISVDDTIHFLTHYRMQYAIDGDIKIALKHTMTEAGQGIVFTTLVLALGFGILAISSTPGVAKVGIFGSLAMIIGLTCDLFLNPALIMLFKLRSDPVVRKPMSHGHGEPHVALLTTLPVEKL